MTQLNSEPGNPPPPHARTSPRLARVSASGQRPQIVRENRPGSTLAPRYAQARAWLGGQNRLVPVFGAEKAVAQRLSAKETSLVPNLKHFRL